MSKDSKKEKGGGRLTPALCNIFGTLLILAVIGLTAPLTLPQYQGFQVYDVVSGSMEPEIPVGSVLYVKALSPEDVNEGDVIAFENGDAVVAHRVVTNRTSLGEFVTKGDANNAVDPDPIPYDALVGRVERTIPLLGKAMALYTTDVGRVYLLMTAACGVMLNILAERMRVRRRAKIKAKMLAAQAEAQARAEAAAADAAAAGVDVSVIIEAAGPAAAGVATEAPAPKRRGSTLRRVLLIILLVIFLGSGGTVAFVQYEHYQSDKTYEEAAKTYVQSGEEVVAAEHTEVENPVPIRVDFDALLAVNPDIIGWIYCEDTTINYPVLHGETNDTYLRHDYTGAYNIDGSIFIDSLGKPDWSDYNTVIYGHHMQSGSMFAVIDAWQEQAYYDEHPYMWLLTPGGDYRVELLSGHHTAATSDMYTIVHRPGKALDAYLRKALKDSTFESKATADPDSRYVMLTTCAYIFENARYVIHGKLVPVNSVGGFPR